MPQWGRAIERHRIQGATLVFLAVLAWASVAARADVSGAFFVEALLLPDGTQTESVKFDVDLQSNLIANWTLSGMGFGIDAGFGSAGVEFTIAGLTAALGPITLFDQLVFAVPFFNAGGGAAATARELARTLDAAGQPNGLAFVKARLGLDFNVAGFSVSNLAILEDVDFPDPARYANVNYFAGGLDALVDTGGTGAVNQTPSLAFGDLITLQGQTRGRVTLTSATGICVQPVLNAIKKRTWPQSVDPGCVGRPLMFTFETLTLSGLNVGGATLAAKLNWRPDRPLAVELSVAGRLAGLADAQLKLVSEDAGALEVSQLSLTVTAGALELRLVDLEADLKVDRLVARAAVTLNPNQNPANLTVFASATRGAGLVFLQPILTVSRGPLSFSASAVFAAASGAAGLAWQSARLSLGARAQDVSLSLATVTGAAGLEEASLSLGVGF